MNTASRICVVFVAAASISFMAFAAALRSGGANWLAEADEIGADYALSTNRTDQGLEYAITHRASGQELKKSYTLAEVVVAARQKQVKDAQQEQQRLQEQAAQLTPQIEAALKAVAADEGGLKLRVAALEKQFADMSAQVEQVDRDILEKASEIQQIDSQSQERREEVYRLRNQLELLRNDLFAAQLQHKNLREEEIRLKELLQRLERRRQQLQSRVGEPS